MFRKFILVAFFLAGLFPRFNGGEINAQTKKSLEEETRARES